MAKLSAVILKAKALRDGKHKIRLAIAHNGKTRYISTDIILDSEKEFKNGSVVKRHDAAYLNTKLRGILQKYQEALDELGFVGNLKCEQLVYLLKNDFNTVNHTLRSLYQEYISVSRAKMSTLATYNIHWKVISSFIDVDCPLKFFSRANVLQIDAGLRKRKIKESTISLYLTLLRSMLNYAKTQGYVFFKINPFAGYTTKKADVRDSWLSVKDIVYFRDMELKKSNHRAYRDLFMLSYYLGGINLTDLLDIDFNKCSSELKYVRSKTNRRNSDPVSFTMPEEAIEIIKRYKGPNGRLVLKANSNKTKTLNNVRSNMISLRKLTGLDNLIFYSARKSFSQHAFELGISMAVIDYLLGHKLSNKGGSSCLYAYLHVTPEMGTEALRKVLDNLK